MLKESLLKITEGLNACVASKLCNRFMLINGLAVSAHGYIHKTEDLDFLLDIETEKCPIVANKLNGSFIPPCFDTLAFDPVAFENLAHDVPEPEDLGRFIITPHVHFFRAEKNLTSAAFHDVSDIQVSGPVSVPVVGIRGLLLLKLASEKPEDAEDIKRLLLHNKFNEAHLKQLYLHATDLGLQTRLRQYLPS